MRCQKCNLDFPENQIDVSHDIPKYLGGTDADGRHNLCKKCHDIYERLSFWAAVESMDATTREKCRENIKKFSGRYFKKWGKDENKSR